MKKLIMALVILAGVLSGQENFHWNTGWNSGEAIDVGLSRLYDGGLGWRFDVMFSYQKNLDNYYDNISTDEADRWGDPIKSELTTKNSITIGVNYPIIDSLYLNLDAGFAWGEIIQERIDDSKILGDGIYTINNGDYFGGIFSAGAFYKIKKWGLGASYSSDATVTIYFKHEIANFW